MRILTGAVERSVLRSRRIGPFASVARTTLALLLLAPIGVEARGQEGGPPGEERAAAPASDTVPGIVTGVVFDSTAAEPLADARVALLNTTRVAATDSEGAFRLEVPPGEYRVRFDHPRLDELGVSPPVPMVRVEPDAESRVVLAIPSRETLLRGWCAADGRGQGSVDVGGIVRDSLTGVPLPEGRVVLRTSRQGRDEARDRETRTDAGGRYRFCGVDGGRWVTLLVHFGDGETEPAPVRLAESGAVVRDFTLRLTDPVTVTGRVVDHASAAPLEDAHVRLEGAEGSDFTDAEGRFALTGMPPGRHVVVTERLGYQTRRDTLTVFGGESVRVEIRLPVEAIALDPLVVEARVRSRAEEMPWKVGTRVDGLTTDEIDAMIHRIRDTAELLNNANVPGLYVRRVTFKDTDGVFRRGLCVELSRSRSLAPGVPLCAMAEVYVDGVRLTQPEFTLETIDHQAIARVQFLSPLEASAIYGTRAQNGVILIETRNGRRR